VYREKEKQLRPERANRKHINVSSVTFRCAVWGLFVLPRAAKFEGAKLGE